MKIIVDCDPGNGIPGANVDDAIALAFALRSPACDVAAIWTVFGNTAASEGEAAATRLLAELGAAGPTIRRGASSPLSSVRGVEWRSRLDAPSQDPSVYPLWAANEPPARDGYQGQDSTPVDELASDLEAAGSGVILTCLGPLTNIAELLTHRPEALRGVARIALMGGCLGEGDLVDTNFAVDPEAAQIVLHSGIPLTIVPLDVTRTTELSPSAWADIRDSAVAAGHPDVTSIARWLEPWMAYSAATRPVNGMWIHDLVVLADVVDPTLVTRRSERVSIAHSPAGKLTIDPHGVEVDLVTSVDNHRLISLWAHTVLGVTRR